MYFLTFITYATFHSIRAAWSGLKNMFFDPPFNYSVDFLGTYLLTPRTHRYDRRLHTRNLFKYPRTQSLKIRRKKVPSHWYGHPYSVNLNNRNPFS